ncbi:MAG: IS91 family transposase [Bryobacteraceae bacterium]
MSRPAFEVADIFRRYGPGYRQRHRLPRAQLRVMRAIEICRTAALGGHLERCDHCHHQRISYNSFRNRHCPKCQNAARARWVQQRKGELLPIQYFHLVFTIPSQLNDLALHNPSVVYKILLDASARTLQTIAGDPKHLGARIGFFSILHTWGQNLLHHPHVHCVATGGGISLDGTRWISCRPGFFLPVRVLSSLFRRLFLESLEAAFSVGKLRFFGPMTEWQSRFPQWLAELAELDWVVYAKPPFGGPPQAIDYLGRYTHRVAISNQRLLDLQQDAVSFAYQDYRSRDHHKIRRMTIAADEFIRRFLLHTLPPGFQRIRHYGLFSGGNKKKTLADCRRLLACDCDLLPSSQQVAQCVRQIMTPSVLCPVCHVGQMIRMEIIPKVSAALRLDSS